MRAYQEKTRYILVNVSSLVRPLARDNGPLNLSLLLVVATTRADRGRRCRTRTRRSSGAGLQLLHRLPVVSAQADVVELVVDAVHVEIRRDLHVVERAAAVRYYGARQLHTQTRARLVCRVWSSY